VSHNPASDRCSAGRIDRANASTVAEMSRLPAGAQGVAPLAAHVSSADCASPCPPCRHRGMPSGWTRAKKAGRHPSGFPAPAFRPFVGWPPFGRTIVRPGGAFARYLLV